MNLPKTINTGRAAVAGLTIIAGAALSPAAEPIRRDEGPKADAHYFERNRDPKLDQWVRPVFPSELKDETEPMSVLVSWTVAADGSVQDVEALAGDERGHEAALAALRQWRFLPALVDGRPEPRSLRMTMVLRPGKTAEVKPGSLPPYRFAEVPLVPPQSRDCPDPTYPKHLVRRALFGEVELNLGVDKQGRVHGVEVNHVTHPDFLPAALAVVERWQLAPARYGRVPVKGEKGARLSFHVIDTETEHTSHEAWLEQNGIRLADANAPEPRLYFDRTPEAVSFVDPVCPEQLRESGSAGEATAGFTVDPAGAVVSANLLAASDDACGAALLAAVATWRFKPFYHGGEAVTVDFRVKWTFEAPTARNTSPENLAVLAADAPFVSARQLDRKLEPLLIAPAVLPPGEKAGGTAEIEFIVNQDGRACWPRITKADSPVVGWAAATAVSRWYFAPPRKDGQPVNVRVIVPVQITL